jgi:hypothetical protein
LVENICLWANEAHNPSGHNLKDLAGQICEGDWARRNANLNGLFFALSTQSGLLLFTHKVGFSWILGRKYIFDRLLSLQLRHNPCDTQDDNAQLVELQSPNYPNF